MIHNYLQVSQYLRDNGIMISFTGKLSQGLIEEYGAAVKSYIESEERPQNEVTQIFSIFIEQTQNINNYCNAKRNSPYIDTITQSSIVAIGKTTNGHFICSGNVVDNADLDNLIAKLTPMITPDKSQLRKLYKEMLRKELGANESAGLGLVEIARKAKDPLEYSVVKLDDNLSFFTLKAVV